MKVYHETPSDDAICKQAYDFIKKQNAEYNKFHPGEALEFEDFVDAIHIGTESDNNQEEIRRNVWLFFQQEEKINSTIKTLIDEFID